MTDLLLTIKQTIDKKTDLPFSVYTSKREQNLLNVPIAKPLLIVVLSGNKELGKDNEIICNAGNFIFLSDSPAINMRNIPKNSEYFALLIEFDYQDFNGLQISPMNKHQYHIGQTTSVLEECLHQFVKSALWAPKHLWCLRKREIIELLCHMGHKQILSMVGNTKLGHRLHDLFCAHGIHAIHEITNGYIAKQLAMSDSTIRRKLNAEGTSIQEIKDQARLGLGLHLLQTTRQPISVIADKCGYQSQSRFTDRFRRRFGLTPSELRKTKMVD